ncbi:hypothetical protein IHQ71_29255 (plasmid) [Rhizobium sp. TH2]|uniref:hypothetical protein n=1 Tax=Rhizobium sp. TH2 TaxID=2775403 RepID=UPI002157BAD5|nr:hypothetical protein [Rhizobium sp. TH2]UVC12316.1 hypothetical protein IHQ71_29255 [Rhizobium sp. TH2]
MAKYVVLGVTGESGYWLVDFDMQSVTPLPDTLTAPFGHTASARSKGATLIANVDMAVTVYDHDDAFNGKYDSVAFTNRFDSKP